MSCIFAGLFTTFVNSKVHFGIPFMQVFFWTSSISSKHNFYAVSITINLWVEREPFHIALYLYWDIFWTLESHLNSIRCIRWCSSGNLSPLRMQESIIFFTISSKAQTYHLYFPDQRLLFELWKQNYSLSHQQQKYDWRSLESPNANAHRLNWFMNWFNYYFLNLQGNFTFCLLCT